MTCIVGYVTKEGQVIIGGDSFGGSSGTYTIRQDKKLFPNGEFVIGCTTSYRMLQLIEHKFIPPPIPVSGELHHYMVTDFVDALRKTFKEGGWGSSDPKEGDSGGDFLVGIRGRLFRIQSDYQVAENTLPYDACGSGEFHAKASIATTLDILGQDSIDPEQVLLKALEIASRFCSGVRAPYFFIKTKKVRGMS